MRWRATLGWAFGLWAVTSWVGCVFPDDFEPSLDADESAVLDTDLGSPLCQGLTPDPCAGACVDFDTDPANCGGCGLGCGEGNGCVSGECVCSAPTVACGSPPLCVDTETDDEHCGACGTVCPDATRCSDGACDCDGEGLALCGGTCVDTEVDAAHCGGCGVTCDEFEFCVDGSCAVALLPDSNDVSCRDAMLGEVACGEVGDLAGQDGDVQSQPLSIADAGTESAFLVPALNLVYTHAALPGTFFDAEIRCQGLDLGGDTDWRLPTSFELIALLDAHANGTDWLPEGAFAVPPEAPVWSQTAFGDDLWAVDFLDPDGRLQLLDPGANGASVCVRGRPTADVSFDYLGTDDHLERASALRFKRIPLDATSWPDAIQRCDQQAATDACDGWHLASVKELSLIHHLEDPGVEAWVAAVDTGGGLELATYWSSTPASDPALAQAYAFYLGGDGSMTLADATMPALALCVCDSL